jgi:hypothetical protein
MRQGGAELDVFCLVQIREGFKEFERLHRIAREHKPFPEWAKRWWLEEKLKELMELTK